MPVLIEMAFLFSILVLCVNLVITIFVNLVMRNYYCHRLKRKKKPWCIMKGVPACICLVEMSLVWFGAQIITEEPLLFLAFDNC